MSDGKAGRGRGDTGSDGPLLGPHAQQASATYGHAADHYELPPLSFWDRFGDETVSGVGLAPGQTVLDLCCGAGASAIPAARAVGANGRVLGIDLASPLLELARARARREGLTNVAFELGDATRTGLSSDTFDAVVCVFGVFFALDMPEFVREMWRLTRPGGIVAITTWGPDLFEAGQQPVLGSSSRGRAAFVQGVQPLGRGHDCASSPRLVLARRDHRRPGPGGNRLPPSS